MRASFPGNAEIGKELDALSGQTWELLGDGARARPYFERAGWTLEVLRQDGDDAALRHLAADALSRRLVLFDWEIADVLARRGMTGEAIQVLRRAELDTVLASDLNFKPMVMHGAILLAALLQTAGPPEEAARLLREATEFSETQRQHGARSAGTRLAAAKVYALGGRTDEALEQVALAVDALDSPFSALYTETDPALARMSGDPRFKAQMKRLREQPGASPCAAAGDVPAARPRLAA